MAEVSDLTQLRAALSGHLIEPGDSGYDQARRVWNGMIDRRPAAIAQCATGSDVVRCVEFARDCGITVAVRGGGHNIAGNAVCDGGLVIDLYLLKQISVDPARRTVRAGGGVVWGEFDAATQQHGLATTGGLISTTGIAGFTLGGGLGYLMRSYGLACDNLLSAELVTADGRQLTVSRAENSDLFWALRGGGGNFGVVTELEFQLHAVGPMLLAGNIFHMLSAAREMLGFYREFAAAAPDALTVYAGLGRGPDGTPRASMRAIFNGSVEAGMGAVQKLRGFGSLLADEIRPRPYLEIQRLIDANFPPGRLNYWKAHFLAELSDEVIDLTVEAFERAPSRYSFIVFEHMGGAVARVGETETAFSHRSAAYSFLILAGWEDPGESEANVAWARDLWEQVRPMAAAGVYVNYLGTEGEQRVREAYGPNLDRLAEIKSRYDPDNFFRMNQNIRPEAWRHT
jgi:FAD/FMN-containing dehydrogenase